MVKRLFDVAMAAITLLVVSPVLLVAALGVVLSGAGGAIYRARRVGLHGRVFTMYKLRTMRVASATEASRITAKDDDRVFWFGRLLRVLKIDELPQLLNILVGDMSIVGPRPEDPEIVEKFYSPLQRETLEVLPGLACPGSLYSYTHGEQVLVDGDTEAIYVERLLPVKLGLDLVYVRERSIGYDLRIMVRTAWTLLCTVCGRKRFSDPPELAKAKQMGLVEDGTSALSKTVSKSFEASLIGSHKDE